MSYVIQIFGCSLALLPAVMILIAACAPQPDPYEPPPLRPPLTQKQVCAEMLAGAAVAEWARVDENTEPLLEMRLAMDCWAALEGE